jgi:hypothetical protein
MATCSRCGNPVDFRYIGGRCIPLHASGGCGSRGGSSGTDFSGYHTSPESACFQTNCPKCGDGVFFIRHNGGSVWIDPPLGPPWYKHACFDDVSVTGQRSNLSSEYRLPVPAAGDDYTEEVILGVVSSTRVAPDRQFTDIFLETGASEFVSVTLKHNAGFLLGKLCVLHTTEKAVWPVDGERYRYAISRTHFGLVTCQKCNVLIAQKNLAKHLESKHSDSEQVDVESRL